MVASPFHHQIYCTLFVGIRRAVSGISILRIAYRTSVWLECCVIWDFGGQKSKNEFRRQVDPIGFSRSCFCRFWGCGRQAPSFSNASWGVKAKANPQDTGWLLAGVTSSLFFSIFPDCGTQRPDPHALFALRQGCMFQIAFLSFCLGLVC